MGVTPYDQYYLHPLPLVLALALVLILALVPVPRPALALVPQAAPIVGRAQLCQLSPGRATHPP